MTQTKEVVQSFFTNFPVTELGSEDQRRIFDGLKARFEKAPDAGEELKNLYKVKGFSDFASIMMWILDRSRRDPGGSATSTLDETLLLSAFRRAMSEQGLKSTPASASAGHSGGSDERSFASQLDKFSDAVQSGVEGRGVLLESIFNDCGVVVQRSTDPEFKQLAALMGDFLKFIAENELLDDVRVINIVSNISSSISQWAMSPPGARHGLMEEALGLLRDFRTHFE
jgi:hypothetical protein